jgi:hypothetical protein
MIRKTPWSMSVRGVVRPLRADMMTSRLIQKRAANQINYTTFEPVLQYFFIAAWFP